MVFNYRDYTLPLNRELRYSLQIMKGVGFRKSFFICAKIGFAFPFFILNVNKYFFYLLSFLFKLLIRSPSRIKRSWKGKLNELVKLGSLRAIKHRDMLPVNGQRTRSNCGVSRRLKVYVLTAQEERKRREEEEKKKQQKV